MDELLVAAGLIVPLVVALSWATWWLIASSRRERRRQRAAAEYAGRYQPGLFGGQEPPAHLLRGQGEAVTVAELLEEATERSEPVRLRWSAEDEAQARDGRWRGTRPYVQDQFPTAILPRIDGRDELDRS